MNPYPQTHDVKWWQLPGAWWTSAITALKSQDHHQRAFMQEETHGHHVDYEVLEPTVILQLNMHPTLPPRTQILATARRQMQKGFGVHRAALAV